MKYCIHVFVFICLLFTLAGCSNPGPLSDDSAEAPQEMLFQYHETEMIPMVTIAVESDFPIDCIAQNSEMIFTLSNINEAFSNQAERTIIFSIRKETGETQALCDISGDGHWCNELKATDKYLFWVYSDAFAVQILQYDLRTGQTDVIREFPAGNTMIMASDNRFLSWYESVDGGKMLFVLDTESGTISPYPEQQKTASPYSHPYVLNHTLISCETSSAGVSELCAYHLENNDCFGRIAIEDFSKVNVPQANQDWIIWANEERNVIWAYNIHSQETIEISNEYYAFSYHLLDDMVCVNDRISNQILFFDLDSKQVIAAQTENAAKNSTESATENSAENATKTSFVLGSSYNSQLIFLDAYSNNLICFST